MTELNHAAAQALEAVHSLLQDPSKWTTGSLARNEGGRATLPLARNAVRWCVMGALVKFCPDDEVYVLAETALFDEANIMGLASPSTVNDAVGHHATLKMLHGAFVRLISRAKPGAVEPCPSQPGS